MHGKPPRDSIRRPLGLVAADHADTRDLYTTVLARLGFDVIGGTSTIEALARVPYVLPDLIITEVGTACGDPWQEIHSIKTDPTTQNIPMVIITADSSPSIRQRSEREGRALFVARACSAEGLAAALRQIVDVNQWIQRPQGL